MKNWIYNFLGLSVLILSGCMSDVAQFSCDKEIDGWIKENLDEVRGMNRQDWLNSSWVFARPIYVAFTPQQKLAFWNEKFEEVKNLSWSEPELNHIKLAQDFINEHADLFNNKKLTDEQTDILETFFYKWENFAIRELNWNRKIVKSIIGTGHKVKNTKGEIQRLSDGNVNALLMKKAEFSCDCNRTNDFCHSTTGGDCYGKGCEDSDWGCGYIWLQSCNGYCTF